MAWGKKKDDKGPRPGELPPRPYPYTPINKLCLVVGKGRRCTLKRGHWGKHSWER